VFGKRAMYTRKVASCCWRLLVVDFYMYISFQNLICICIHPLNKIQNRWWLGCVLVMVTMWGYDAAAPAAVLCMGDMTQLYM